MSDLMVEIKEKAKKAGKTIVLPEGNDKRVVEAAEKIASQGIANVVLLGDLEQIKNNNKSVDLSKVKVINPKTIDNSKYAQTLFELRKSKGITLEQATELAKDELYFAVLMLQLGEVDGMVAGACHSTGDVLRPGLQIVKTVPGIKTVSSCFVMVLPKGSKYGHNGTLIFGDCAVIPDPTPEQLADIAASSATSAKKIAGIIEPKVAMLSFSTMGSAKHPNVDKVNEAVKLIKDSSPWFSVDGELQADAALVEAVGKLKAPKSNVAGSANVLIFPDLQSGNIGYKLVERLAGAEAIGPICQGFNKPLNDLSRGCSVDDVVSVAAITVLQSIN